MFYAFVSVAGFEAKAGGYPHLYGIQHGGINRHRHTAGNGKSLQSTGVRGRDVYRCRAAWSGDDELRRHRDRGWMFFSGERSDAGILGKYGAAVLRDTVLWCILPCVFWVGKAAEERKYEKEDRAVSSVYGTAGYMAGNVGQWRYFGMIWDGGVGMKKMIWKLVRNVMKDQPARRALAAEYTVEAAGVMAVVLFTIMILMNQAFRLHAETTGYFSLHEAVEKERHAVDNRDEAEIVRKAAGSHWNLEIAAPVYRPENSLRMWSLAEDLT